MTRKGAAPSTTEPYPPPARLERPIGTAQRIALTHPKGVDDARKVALCAVAMATFQPSPTTELLSHLSKARTQFRVRSTCVPRFDRAEQRD